MDTWQALTVVAGVAAALVGTPLTRQWLIAHARCVVTRHRLQRLCRETTLHTRSGRLPLVLWISPTAVGERALVWCRAGISAEGFEAYLGEIRAACFACEARVSRNERHAQLVTVEIVRTAPLPSFTKGL
jgi:hypothetical protein